MLTFFMIVRIQPNCGKEIVLTTSETLVHEKVNKIQGLCPVFKYYQISQLLTHSEVLLVGFHVTSVCPQNIFTILFTIHLIF